MFRTKNRHKITLLAALVVLCILSSKPTIASVSQSVLPDVDMDLGRNWDVAGLPDYPIVLNNLEDFVDQLSDLHAPDDIGTHSDPATLQVLDGVFNTLQSSNVTIPEQLIEDPLNETPPYNQSEYQSWQLDLELSWTDVDHIEISAELCVYGGTQVGESLRVDIWQDDGWINVISDVVVGWNNVSIAPSLVDETLEMRFAITNGDNTSVQSSWDIDAVLLHTWTTVYGSEYTQNGIIQDLGNNLSRYIASIGEINTWNEVNETWHRYLYDPDAKTVQIGNLTITHLPGGALSIDGDAGSRVGKLSWYIQAYYGDQWNNITLDNYEFVGFTKTADNVTAHQRFWGSQGEMNVYLTYSYLGGFKTRVDIRNDAAQAVPIRAIWAARDVSGLQDNYELLYDENDVLCGIQIEDAVFSWYDVLVSDNPLPTQTVIDKPNRRAAVIFGNQSTVIPAGYTATIDPLYAVSSDDYDNYWNAWAADRDRYDAATENKLETDSTTYSYQPSYSIALAIPKYAIITSATTSVYVRASSAAVTATVQRINSVDVGVLEGAAWISSDSSLSSSMSIGTGWKTSQVGAIVQKQVGLSGWASGQYMGFRIKLTSGTSQHTIEDYSRVGSALVPQITATFVNPAANWLAGYQYRQGHSIDGSTGAGTLYPIEIHVEYGSGTSSSGTIYCDEHCDTDFDDIRFTNAGGQTQLSYWMEEKTDSDDATFWVEVDADLGSDQVIYCYYGKSGDSTTSNIKTTFLVGDDFNDGSIDTNLWDIEVAGFTEVSGYLHFDYAGAVSGVLNGKTAYTYNIEMVTSIKCLNTPYGGNIAFGFWQEYGVSPYDRAYNGWSAGNTRFYRGTADESVATSAYRNSWVPQTLQEISIFWISGHVYFRVNGALDEDRTANVPNEAIYPALYEGSNDAYQNDMDWVYYRKRVYTEPAHYTWGAEEEALNNVPVNDMIPVCTNLDDGDNLYARYEIYNFSTSVTDADGATDIHYIDLYCVEGVTTLWIVRYNQSNDAFTEIYGFENIQLTGSVYDKDGINLDVWFGIRIEWAHADVNNYDLKQVVVDNEPENDTDTYTSIDYDYDTDLVTTFGLSDGSGTVDRGNYSSVDTITASGTVSYEDSGGDNYPTTAEVDMYIRCSDVAGSDWYDTTLTSGAWSMTVDSDDIVGLDTYYVKAVQAGGNYDSATLLGATTSDTYIADALTITITGPTDNRQNLNLNASGIVVSAVYDYGGAFDGTLTLNNTDFDGDGFVGKWGYTVTIVSGGAHGVTAISTNDETYMIWDALTVWIAGPTDNRQNINANATGIIVSGIYDFDSESFDGTLTLNNTDFDGDGTVVKWGYTVATASGGTHGITLIAYNDDTFMIWDRIYAVSLSYGGDTRINAGTSVDFEYELHYDYDEGDVDYGTITINGFSFSGQFGGIWKYTTSNGGDVGDITFDNIVASGNTHGITETTTNGNDVTLIWDEIEVYYGAVSDARTNVDEQENADFRLRLKYDSHLLNDGTNDDVWINSSVAAWGEAISAWYRFYTQSTVGTWNFVVTSASEDTYGITAFDSASAVTYGQDIIWDRIGVDVAVNMTWTIIDYYVNVSYTGTYEYDSTTWSGYATVTNTSLTTGGAVRSEELTFSTVVNKTFTVTAVEDAGGYDITVFTTDTEWCVWDDISVSAEHFWTQQSATQVWLRWSSGLFTWSNTSAVASSPQIKIQSQMNATDDDWGYIVDGYCGDLIIGDFNPSWYYVNITIRAQFNGYDWVFWSQVIRVDILHSLQTNIWDLNREGNYYTLLMHTNYENASVMVWDDLEVGSGFNDSIYYGDYEGMHEWLRDTTVGTHNCTILINAGGDKGAVERDYVANDLRLWYNFTYIISPAILAITNPIYTASDEQNFLSGEINVGCDWYAYNNDTEIDTGVLGAGSFAIDWDKNTTVGYYVWGVKFDDGTTVKWINGTFEVSAIVLTITNTIYIGNAEYNDLSGQTNAACDYYLYENETQETNGNLAAGSFHIGWDRNTTVGLIIWGAKFDDGTTVRWVNGSYYNAPTTYDDLMLSAVSFTAGTEEIAAFIQTNWNNCTIHLYDNDTIQASGAEGSLSYANPQTVGLHRVGCYVNGTAQNLWVNFTYSVAAEADLSITALTFDTSGVNVSIFVNTNWGNTTVTVYEDDVEKDTASEGALTYVKATAAGNYSIGIKIDGGTDLIWANFTYTIGAEDSLSITSLSFGTGGSDITAFATTNWLNATLTLYEDDVEKDTGSEGTTLSYTKATVAGDYNIGLKIDGGTDFIWANYTYTISAEDVLSITSLSFGTDGAEVTAFATTNWMNATLTLYEDDVEKDTDSEGTTLSYTKTTVPGDYSIGLKIDGGASMIWANYTYTIEAEDALSITSLSFGTGGSEVTAFATTNWMNATLTLYENDAQKDTGNEGTTLSYTKATAAGDYNIGLKIDGGADFIWANYTYTVTAEDSLSITALTFDTSGVNISVFVNTNWGNCTITVYEDDNQKDTGGEGSLTYVKATTAGNYSVGIKINGTADYIWANYTYSVAAAETLSISNTVYTATDTRNYISGHTNLNCDWYAYNNDTLMNSGGLTSGSFQVDWSKNTTVGLYEWGVKFDDGTTIRWVNGSFEISAVVLAITNPIYIGNAEWNDLSAHTNVACDYYVYENDTQIDTGALGVGSLHIGWPRNTTDGLIVWGIKFDDGVTIRWVNGSYYNTPITYEDLMLSAVSFTAGTEEIAVFIQTNWNNCTIHLYDNDTIQASGAEGSLSYANPQTIGLHRVGVYVNGTAQSLWVNFTYSVAAEADLSITALNFDTSGVNVSIFVNTNWGNTTITVYEDDVQKTTGSEGTLSYTKTIAAGDYSVGIKVDGGAGLIWANYTYTISAEDVLSITSLSFGTGGSDITAFATTNWMNATLTLYEDDVEKDTGSEGTTLSYTKATVAGDYNIGLKIDGGASMIWANYTYTIEAEDILSITSLSFGTEGADVTAFATTNWLNATLTLYENDDQKDTGPEGTTLSYTKATTAGDYNIGLKIDGGANLLWANYTYSVAAAETLSISNTVYTATDSRNLISGHTNLGCDWYAYNNDTEMDTGTLGAGSFAIDWNKNTTVGYYIWGVKFDDGTTVRWINGTFEVSAIVLAITNTIYIANAEYNDLTGHTNIGCDYYLYENETQETNGNLAAGSFHIGWDRNITIGLIIWGAKFDDGTTVRWVNGSYYNAPTTYEDLMLSAVSFTAGTEEIAVFIQTNWNNCTIHLYDNDTIKASGTEGSLSYTNPQTVGLHRVGCYVNGTAQSLWVNFTYSVAAEADISITALTFDTSGVNVSIFVNTNWGNATVTVYEDDVEKDTGDEGVLTYVKATAAGNYSIGIKVDGGSDLIWANFTYTIDAEDSLSLTSLSFGTGGSDVTAFATTNWMNTTLTLYEDDVEKDTGSEGTTLSYTKTTVPGDYSIGLKIDGGASMIWANYTYTVTAEDSLSITALTFDSSGVNVTAFVNTNWGNCTITVYEDDVEKDTGGEGSLTYVKATSAGNYSVGIKIDGGADLIWANYTYSVAAAETLSISNTVYTATEERNYVSGQTNLACDWYAYNNDTLMNSGGLTSGSFQVDWAKNTTVGLYEWGVRFDDGTTVRWVNGSFEISAVVLAITNPIYIGNAEWNDLSAHTNVACDYYVYENDTQIDTGALGVGSLHIGWARNTTDGLIVWGIKFDDGITTRWVNGSYYNAPTSYDDLMLSAVSFTAGTEQIAVFIQTNWNNCTIHLYDNDTIKASGNEGSLSYENPQTVGLHQVGCYVNGTAQNLWVNFTYSVAAEADLSITALTFDTSGVNVSIFVNTNWGNTTVTVYEDDVEKDTASEGALTYVKATTAGNYSVGIKIDGGIDLIWANFTYTIGAEDALSITSLSFGTGGSEVTAFATTNWLNATLTLYEDDVEKDTGSEGTTLSYTKATAAGDYNIGLKIDGGADFIWANYTYTISAEDVLSITSLSFGTDGADVTAFATTNWMNATLTLYEDDVEKDTGSEGTTLSYTKTTVPGDYSIGLKIDAGASMIWANYTYTIEAEDVLSITSLSFGTAGADVTAFATTNWLNATLTLYEDDVEKDTGSEGTTLSYTKTTVPGDYSIGLKIDGGASMIWANYTYTVTAEDSLSITALTFDSSGVNVTAFVNTNWGNCTITVYEDDVEKDTGGEGSLTYVKATAAGNYSVGIKIDGGADLIWANYTYSVAAAETLSISNTVYTATDSRNHISGHTNLGCDWYAYNNDTEIDTGTIGVGSFAINWDKNTTVGYYEWGVKFDDGTTIRWVNGTFEIEAATALLITVEDWSPLGSTILFVGTCNSPFSYWVYREGVYNSEMGTAGTDSSSYSFDIARVTDAGEHTYQIYFNSSSLSGSRWFNFTDTVSSTYAWQYIEISDQSGKKIDYELDIYVNGSLLHAERFYGRTDVAFEIAIFDKFGDELSNTTYDAPSSRQYNITLSLYSFKIKSWVDGKILVYVYSSGGGNQSTWLAWDSEYEWFVFSGKSYQMQWETDTGTIGVHGFGTHYFPALDVNCLTPDPTWYSPVGASFVEIDAFGVAHLYARIPDSAGGGGDFTQEDADMVVQSIVDEFNPLLLGVGKGRLSLMIVGVFMVLAYAQYFFTVKKISKPKVKSDKDKASDKSKPTTVSTHQGKDMVSTSQSKKKESSHK